MCGFLVYFKKNPLEEHEIKHLERSLNLLNHRGPDHKAYTVRGNVFLGHTRLSIVDLDERANQPFCDGNHIIVFNGEIYNYKELKEELKKRGHTFRTNSDTEVILKAFKEWGKDSLNHFVGMFSFCIYDSHNDELFCARDRIGEKPLIFSQTEKGLIVASEIKPILESGLVKKQIDEEKLLLLFLGNYKHIPEPFSLWSGIEKLRPAEYFVARKGWIVERGFYWRPEVENYRDISEKELKEELIKAIDYTTVADVPISILLSGGTDSSIIAFVVKEILKKEIYAFTFGRKEDDEEIQRARFVAEKLKIPLRVFYFQKEDIKRRMENVIKHYGEPLTLWQFAYADLLYENIKKEGFKVVLTGNGSDEIFYGYISHPRTFLLSLFLKPMPFGNPLIKKWKWLKGACERLKKARIPEFINKKDLCQSINKLAEELLNALSYLLEPFEGKYYIDYSNFLGLISENAHSITLIGDIAGMKHSVEVRNPFLNHHIVEIGFSIHPRKKLGRLFDRSGTYNKYILKKAFEKEASFLREIFYRRKMGFGFAVKYEEFFKNQTDFVKFSYEIVKKSFLGD